MKKLAARIVLFIVGWKVENLDLDIAEKSMHIAFPHSSTRDIFIGMSYIFLKQIEVMLFVSHKSFYWPFEKFMLNNGCIKVDRSLRDGLTEKLAREFENNRIFRLLIMPEATRRKKNGIRTGFWYIAHKASIPVYCWLLDHKKKSLRCIGRIDKLTSLDNDLAILYELYRDEGYLIPLANKFTAG